MSEVIINFREEFEEPLLNDIKVMTSRSEAKGKAGDTFTAFGHRFRIIYVREETLGNIAKFFWREEGVSSENAFIRTWDKIHPNKPFDETTVVYLHRFTRVR